MGAVANLSSPELIDLVRMRHPASREAWNALVDRHVRLVWKVIRTFHLSNESAWDTFQSTWLRAVERLETLRDPAAFPAWLATIARNESLAAIRARNKYLPVSNTSDGRSNEPAAGEELERQELEEAVREGFQSLSQRDQNLLRLLSADPPLSYMDIERLLGMPHGSIGPTRRRCLDKLGSSPALVAFFGEA